MKKILKILSLLLLVIIIALLVIPHFYKDEIATFIKEDLNKNFNAHIDYQDVSLSLFKDFPNLSVGIDALTIDGIDDFQGVRLADIKNFSISLNAKKVFIDKEFVINKIKINQLNLNLLVLKNGKANYDVVKENPNDSIQKDPTSFELKLKEYKLVDSSISYLNQTNNMQFAFENIDHFGSGKITDKAYNLQTKTHIKNANFEYGVKYLNQADLKLTSDILIENDYNKFSFQNNTLSVNDLDVDLTQSVVELQGEDVFMDIAFQTKNDQLKELLSLVPKTYLTSIENIVANGNANLKGFVKGIYNENTYPAYEFDMSIADGVLKYSDLPESLQAINVLAKVAFKGGKNLDNTSIDLPKINFSIANNTVEGSLKVNNPMTDPLIQTHFKSKLNLNKLQQAIKITNIKELKGLLDADFNLKGRLSAIENKQFNNFKASGFFNLDNFTIKSDSIPYEFEITKAELDITPEALKVKNLTANIGQNDFALTGEISNYIAYFLSKEEVLKADFKAHATFINLNDFMTDADDNNEQTNKSGFLKIPKNIDLTLIADAETLQYKDMVLKEVEGKVSLKDGKANLKAMLLKTLEGQMVLNGEYDSSSEKPFSKFDISIEQMSIVKSATTFSAFQAFAPVLQKVQGNFFSNMNMNMHFDEQMNPILSTVKANGNFNTSSLQIAGIDILNKIGSLLKIDALKKPNVDQIKAHFGIENGKMSVKPFTFKLNNMQSSFEGTVNLDKQIDFILGIDIPKDKLGANPNALLEGIVGKLADLGLKTDLGAIIKMKFRIKGDYNNPKILPAIAGYEGATVKEIITEIIEDKVDEVVDDTIDKAREEAQKQADKLMEAAQVQADSLVSKAQQLSVRLSQEAQIQGDNLISKAKNPFEKIAAKAAASQLNKEANKKGVKLVDKAKEKSKILLQNAQEKADKLIQTPIKKETD
ncbi:MAG TPA: hypothetical protein EYG92_12200 [Lutibacter sp.]|nr:hypothetical protein [Lutibacter sp.]